MAKQTKTWTEVCEALWGGDWIAPLSDTLHVNRRTVERWRSGKVAIPTDVETMIVAAFPRHVPVTRELGDLLRLHANGATHRQLMDRIEAQRLAWFELQAMQMRGSELYRLATSEKPTEEDE